jgi:hypothetical protein
VASLRPAVIDVLTTVDAPTLVLSDRDTEAAIAAAELRSVRDQEPSVRGAISVCGALLDTAALASLVDALFHKQDECTQHAAALATVTAVESCPVSGGGADQRRCVNHLIAFFTFS